MILLTVDPDTDHSKYFQLDTDNFPEMYKTVLKVVNSDKPWVVDRKHASQQGTSDYFQAKFLAEIRVGLFRGLKVYFEGVVYREDDLDTFFARCEVLDGEDTALSICERDAEGITVGIVGEWFSDKDDNREEAEADDWDIIIPDKKY